MTSLEEKKAQQLKYTNINWITIPPTAYKSPRGVTPRRIVKNPSMRNQPIRRPYFRNSDIYFTEPEIEIIRKADYENEQDQGINLRKSPSRLQQLQFQQEERMNDIFLSQSFKIPQEEPQYEDTQSVCSIDPNDEYIEEEEEDKDEENFTMTAANEKNSPAQFFTAMPTIQDIKDHVWLWCHENGPKEEKDPIHEYPARFVRKSGVNEAIKETTAGERKVKRIISRYSKTEREREANQQKILSHKIKLSTSEEENRKRLSKSYSAMKYRKYSDKKRTNNPDFIEDLDFTELKQERRVEKKLWRKNMCRSALSSNPHSSRKE